MKTLESIQWLKQHRLFELAKKHTTTFKKVYQECLHAKHDEQILVIGDTGNADYTLAAVLAGGYYLAAQDLNLRAELVMQSGNNLGNLASLPVATALKALPKKSIIIANVSNRLGSLDMLGTKLRQFAKQQGHRFISTPSLGYVPLAALPYFVKALNVDYQFVRRKHVRWCRAFENKKEVHVTTKKGTDLVMNIQGRPILKSDGLFNQPGTGGNLPVGEVYIAPNERKTHGVVVIDGSSRNRLSTKLTRTPIKLHIENGKIVDIEGDTQEARLLQEAIRWAQINDMYPENCSIVGEFGIGSNPAAKVLGSTIIDEKVYGTAHIAIGSNRWFGGTNRTIIHLDQVFKNPEIKIDGKKLDL